MNKFDHIIHEKLSDALSHSPLQPDWERMESRLQERLFDEQMRQPLEQVDATGALGTGWDALSKELHPETSFDHAIQHKLSRTSVPAAAEWSILREYLQQIAANRNTYLSLKTFEGLILLCLLTFVHIQPHPNQAIHQVAEWTRDSVQQVVNSSVPSIDRNDVFPTAAAEQLSRGTHEDIASITEEPDPIKELSAQQEYNGVQEQRHAPHLQSLPLRSHSASVLPEDSQNDMSLLAMLGQTAPVLIHDAPMLPTAVLPAPAPVTLSISAFGSYDRYSIHTPAYARLGIEEHTRKATGYGIGAEAQLSRHRWAGSLGLSLHQLSYGAPSHIEKFEYTARSFRTDRLTKIEMRILQVPLSLQYDWIHGSKWRLYQKAGIGLQLITATHYERQHDLHYIPITRPTLLAESNTNQVNRSSISEVSQLDYSSGMGQTGAVLENLYMYAHIGAGVSYSISPRYAWYAEPMYRGLLFDKAFGPFDDRLQGWSLRSGIRVSL